MNKLQQKFETVFAGIIYVAIGTALAVQVDAQSSPTPKPAVPSTAPSKAHAANCDSKQPDALCTVDSSASSSSKSEMQICFGGKHSRCYELNKGKMTESVNKRPGRENTVLPAESLKIVSAVREYRSWLEKQKAGPATSVCRNVVSVSIGADKKEFCTANLPRKDMQAKNKELFALLDTAGVSSAR